MITFEGFERRIEKITGVLNEYGIRDLEEAKAICDKAGVDAYGIVKGRNTLTPTPAERLIWNGLKS